MWVYLCYHVLLLPIPWNSTCLLTECTGARTKLIVCGCVYCPLCLIHCFPLLTTMSSSPQWSVLSQTCPPSNNTPLSVRGTETAHRVHCKDVCISNMDLNQTQGLGFGPVTSFHSFFISWKTTLIRPHCSRRSSRLKIKGLLSMVTLFWPDKSHNPRMWLMFFRWTWRRKNQTVILNASLLLHCWSH